MTKQQYLDKPIIKEFIEWLSPLLDIKFTHSYIIHQRNASWVRYNGGNNIWNCTSIYDAFLKYYWEGSNFAATSILLNGYEVSLRTALATNNNANIDLACQNILRWGGQRVFTPNYQWIQKLANISQYFNKNIIALNPNLFNDDIAHVQSYDFLMMGYLIDEEEFEIKPAISRTVQLLEAATQSRGKKKSYPKNPSLFPLTYNFSAGTTAYTENYKYTADLSFESNDNVSSWDVYINDDYYGSDLSQIQLTSGNNLTLNITPTNPSLDSQIVYIARLI
jgi:hypothetical protein